MEKIKDDIIGTHVFTFNPHDNGGEALMLKTEKISNGDPDGYYFNQTLTLQSYGNSASFNLYGAQITPLMLRKLADELEKKFNMGK